MTTNIQAEIAAAKARKREQDKKHRAKMARLHRKQAEHQRRVDLVVVEILREKHADFYEQVRAEAEKRLRNGAERSEDGGHHDAGQ